MQWFKHDADAATDSKIKKLIIKYGAEGYAIYFHCLELIMGDVNEKHITFELEHDAEIIADNLKIKGTADTAPIDRVNEIMRYICSLGLFSMQNNRIFCFKLLSRLDSSMTSNSRMRNIIQDAKGSHDAIMIPSCKKRIDKIRIEENRKENKEARKAFHFYGEVEPVYLSDDELAKLHAKYGKMYIDAYINKISLWEPKDGKRPKNDYMTILRWMDKDKIPLLPPPPPKCPHCGVPMIDGCCHNKECPQYL
jgi:hypothetical protein